MKNFSELFSAFDYIDEVIYICDMDTYDLVYCNKKLEENLLDAYQANQSGYKCYKCLHGFDQPCAFCNNDILRQNKRCIWSRQHPQHKKYYLLHDSVISIDGRDYRMELAVDTTHLEEAAAVTRQKLDVETHLVEELRDMNFHDPLTGVYNRKGFEQITENIAADKFPIAFLMIDIDNFKMINDTYGHSIGDEILKETANLLTSVFRSKDEVFRLGGDEFAVLLCNCNVRTWKTICSKIQWIHTSLAELYQKMAVTLSGGICFTLGKYNENIYRLADEAMYDTKKNGRAGCTMVNESTGERRCWKDDTLSPYSRSVLNFNSTGLYRIEYPLDGKTIPRMVCGNAVKEMFDFPVDADAETCYKLWLDGVEPSYLEVLADARHQLMENIQVECTYQWKHPKYGLTFIRSIGTSEIRDGVQILYGYHHSIKDTRIIEKKEESQLLLEAISSIYFGSYYVNLDQDTYSTIKYAPNERYLNVEEGDAQKSLLNFVSILARKSDHEKMNQFVNLSTLAARMINETHLDCEYYAVKENKWCRATFIPVKYHEDGTLSHALFEVAPLDIAKAQETEESAQNKKTVESLYNRVPGGLVMYEWDGKKLKILHISRYYAEIYGDSTLSKSGEPNFQRVHPDDLPELKKAIQKALTQTNHLEYVYRGWNNKKQGYDWIKMNADSELQEDGTSLIYAMFSDVTGQKEAELQLMKKHASLTAALGAFNQLCYEYDPKTHREECLTEDYIFHLPRVLENYPESMLDYVYPEDQETFLNTIHSMDDGKLETSCNIRLLRDGEYVWYAYQLQSLFDSERGRSIVSISVMDNSEHMTTIQNYQARMNMIMGMTEDAVSFGSINLTQNTFKVIQAGGNLREIANNAKTLDELFQITSLSVIGSKDKEQYQNLFSRKNLIALMKKGQMHVHMDHMYQTTSRHVEWVRTSVDMLHNPSSKDIVGVCYSKSIQNEKLSNMLLEKTLQRDYPLAAIIEVKSERYYLFDSKRNEYCVGKNKFWDSIANNLALAVDHQAVYEVEQELRKEHILKILNDGSSYSFSFNGMLYGEKCRLEVKIDYVDDSREMILATLRDITDRVILEQLRHDNERDALTDLYNRRKTFAECKRLLEQYPDDQFAMLHFDIRHFRLYNTFFGDAAGDKLLRDIADMFRKMDQDYDYWVYGRIESDVFCVFFPISQNKYQKHLNDLLHGLSDYRPDFLIEPAIGIYTVTDRKMQIESMFTRASIAAKTVRSGVTNSVIFYDEGMEQELVDGQQIINDMQSAIEQEQFQVYLQPKYSLKIRKSIGAEALVRWIHPQKGLIAPDEFIPVFERNGFIATLDRYMWEHVCQLLQKWQNNGYKLMPVSVNVSRISMYNPTTVQFLKDLVVKYQLHPKYLELELTESAYMDDPQEIKKQLRELQDYGFRILMDDFGSGYSSLNTLRELPVNGLKLDKEFLSESSGDERGRMILASVVSMSKMLNLTIIAEGVETPEQAEFLMNLGCEYVQGFLFARPMPVEIYEQVNVDRL